MLTAADIEQMTVSERWEAMELLWESIVTSGAEIPSPDWHEEVLQERMAKIESGQAKFLTLEELRVKLRIPKP